MLAVVLSPDHTLKEGKGSGDFGPFCLAWPALGVHADTPELK